MAEEKKKYAAPSVDGLLDILELMAGQQRPFGPTELSRTLGISNNLVFRIMRRLAQRGYAEMDSDGRYTLGSKFMSIGLSIQSSFELRRKARRHLEELCHAAGETCQLQILEGESMLCLDAVAPSSYFYLSVMPGSKLHLHPNSFGKNVMAFLPEERVDKLLKGSLPALTPKTLVSKEAVKKELEETRRTGLSYDREEYITGVFCISSPVFGPDGCVRGGVGVTAMASRMNPETKAKDEALVLGAAAAVSCDIGYTGDFFKKLKG